MSPFLYLMLIYYSEKDLLCQPKECYLKNLLVFHIVICQPQVSPGKARKNHLMAQFISYVTLSANDHDGVLNLPLPTLTSISSQYQTVKTLVEQCLKL